MKVLQRAFITTAALVGLASTANNLASGGIGQVSNTIIPGGTNCSGLVNCNVGGPAATSITPNANAGYRTDSMVPTSQNASQMAALGGLEIGYTPFTS
jgi:hypothetical protein